jgi:beta-aspartyl-peptidase (threonine type)
MTAAAQERSNSKKRFAIAVHGGAGTWERELSPGDLKAVEPSMTKALDLGVKVLEDGGTSLDAVEQVIRLLEDDPLYDAGRGSVFNSAGFHELDASIMDGRTKACGAVGAVRTVQHPISLARLVMSQTRYVLLVGDGAERFADETQVERVENSWFDTDRERQSFEKRQRADREGKQSLLVNEPRRYGTVGCVALDSHGNLAAGTSTGGLSYKRPGRLGDSPVIAAGTYADNATCAVSCTGTGEEYIRNAIAYDVSARMKYARQSLAEAVDAALRQTLKPGDGGLIAVSADGTIVMDFTTQAMARAAADSSGRREVKVAR